MYKRQDHREAGQSGTHSGVAEHRRRRELARREREAEQSGEEAARHAGAAAQRDIRHTAGVREQEQGGADQKEDLKRLIREMCIRDRVYFSELKDFAECGLCGTAAVISPVGLIDDHGTEIRFPSGMEKMGPVIQKLYDTLTGIQMGRIEGPKGWVHTIL